MLIENIREMVRKILLEVKALIEGGQYEKAISLIKEYRELVQIVDKSKEIVDKLEVAALKAAKAEAEAIIEAQTQAEAEAKAKRKAEAEAKAKEIAEIKAQVRAELELELRKEIEAEMQVRAGSKRKIKKTKKEPVSKMPAIEEDSEEVSDLDRIFLRLERDEDATKKELEETKPKTIVTTLDNLVEKFLK